MKNPAGDVLRFDQNWRTTQEAHYLHWTRSEPENQIQLAFRKHWLTFQELMGPNFKGRRVLEVGCGRGSLSAYFADAGVHFVTLGHASQAIERQASDLRFVASKCPLVHEQVPGGKIQAVPRWFPELGRDGRTKLVQILGVSPAGRPPPGAKRMVGGLGRRPSRPRTLYRGTPTQAPPGLGSRWESHP